MQLHRYNNPGMAVLKRLLFLGGIIVILTIYLYQISYYWHYTNDDAYITLRYSRFLALGYGPYFNSGEHVEGYTNFLLMLLLSRVIKWFGADWGPIIAKYIGTSCGILAILSSYLLTYALLSRYYTKIFTHLWAFCTGGIVAVSPAYAVNSTNGLETTLFSFFLIAAVLMAIIEQSHKKWLGSGILFAGALLTRPEGSLLFAVFWLVQVIQMFWTQRQNYHTGSFKTQIITLYKNKRLLILGENLLIVLVIFSLHLFFRYTMYDGEWLPNTYYAKAGGFWKIAPLTYIWQGVSPSFLGIGGIILSLGSFLLNKEIAKPCLPLGVIAITGCFLPVITGTDWMIGWRLLMPYLPLMACYVVIGWSIFCSRFLTQSSTLVWAIIVTCLLSLWFLQQGTRQRFRQETYLRAFGYQTGHRAVTRYLLDGRLQPGDTIALMDIGIIGYECIEQNILDITGLTNRFIAKSPGGFLQKIYDPTYILEQHPTIIILIVTAPGISYQQPMDNVTFSFWTNIERALYQHPSFQQHYVRHRQQGSDTASWLDELACQIGAEKIFEHGHPSHYYLLAVFRHQ